MVDDLYVVGLDFRQLGTPDLLKPHSEVRMRRMQSSMDRFRSGFQEIQSAGGGVMRVMDGLAGAVGRIALVGGGLVTALGVAGITKATVGLNSELEKATISLGTVFNVQGMSSGLNQGLAMAAGTIKDMRADAAALPGEFLDLMNIFKLGATSAFQSGLGIDEWRQLASKTMAAGVVADLGGGLPQVAREMTMLLQGRAGAHNVFGMTLGLSGAKAEEFNKMTGPERVRELDKVLSKYGQSIETFSRTWDAVSSTFVDNAKMFALTATSPLFDRIKGQIQEANDWFDQNQETVQRYAEIVGMRLGEIWDLGKEKVLEWGPILLEFVDNARTGLGQLWDEIEPGVTHIGELLKEALKDPGTIDKMITLAKLWVGLKAGQAAFGVGSTAFGLGKGAFNMGGGLLGMGGKVAQAGAFGLAAGGGTAAAGAAGAAGAGAAGAGIGASLAGLGLAAGAATLALGAWGLAIHQGVKLYQENAGEEEKNRAAMADAIQREIAGLSESEAAEKLDRIAWESHEAARKLADFQRSGDNAAKSSQELAEQMGYTQATIMDVDTEALNLKASLYAAAAAAQHFAAVAGARIDQVTAHVNEISAEGPGAMKTVADEITMMTTLAAQKALADPNFLRPPKGAEGAHHKGGAGGTKVQKVEIVVTSNQNPSRIARQVMDEIGHLNRTAKASKYARNSAGVSRT